MNSALLSGRWDPFTPGFLLLVYPPTACAKAIAVAQAPRIGGLLLAITPCYYPHSSYLYPGFRGVLYKN
jgi:hypothetical protein